MAAEAAAASSPPSSSVAAAAAASSSDRIVVVFRAAGGAPILAQPKVKVSLDSKFSKVVGYLRRQLDRSDGVVRAIERMWGRPRRLLPPAVPRDLAPP
jgi:hypothetical protein